jgi:DnaD/phage-associated family protein
MSEERQSYEQEAVEAADMLGKGYDSLIKDEGPHDFYCQIPNLVDDYGLSPQAYRLYGHLRRVTGENGKCWQNTPTLALACTMSAGSVSNAKKELVGTEFIPFIRVRKVPMKSGFSYDEITLADLWQLNHDVYSSPPVHNVNGSEYERLVHNVKQRISLLKKTPKIQEEEATPRKNLFVLYEQEIGIITPLIADSLSLWEKEVPEKWIVDAMTEAVRASARRWNYIEAILKRWKAQGNQEPVKKTVRMNSKPQQPTVADNWLARKQQEAANGNG